MMLKAINSHRSSSFQQFKDDIIKKIRHKPVIQDIDLIRLAGEKIKYLIEVKKSFSEDWMPYVKNNYPHLGYNKLDDFNYKALLGLASLIPVDVIVFYYVENRLTELGIKPFRLLNNELKFKSYRFFSQKEIQNYLVNHCNSEYSHYLKNRNEYTFKDQQNPNIKNDEQNIYVWLAKNNVTSNFYYVENKGAWTMLMSDGATYKPIWIYIELNLDINFISLERDDLINYFQPQIRIHEATDVPFSIIGYREKLSEFQVYEYNKGRLSMTIMNELDFIEYYSKFAKKVTVKQNIISNP